MIQCRAASGNLNLIGKRRLVVPYCKCNSFPHSTLLPSVVFLVVPTGGGKSHVHDIVAAASPGVTLSISPLLALGADQESNLNLGIYNNCNPVTAFHVDEILNDKKKWEEVMFGF
jgi:hypothetical protein